MADASVRNPELGIRIFSLRIPHSSLRISPLWRFNNIFQKVLLRVALKKFRSRVSVE